MLRDLQNLGPASERMLARAGIDSESKLRQLGAVKAFLLVRQCGAKPSLNLLWALEGALTDQPWRVVSQEHRLALLLQLDDSG